MLLARLERSNRRLARLADKIQIALTVRLSAQPNGMRGKDLSASQTGLLQFGHTNPATQVQVLGDFLE